MAGAGDVVDDVGGPEAQCLPRAAVVLTVGLDVVHDAAEVDVQPIDRGLGHSTPGCVQLRNGAVRRWPVNAGGAQGSSGGSQLRPARRERLVERTIDCSFRSRPQRCRQCSARCRETGDQEIEEVAGVADRGPCIHLREAVRIDLDHRGCVLHVDNRTSCAVRQSSAQFTWLSQVPQRRRRAGVRGSGDPLVQ